MLLTKTPLGPAWTLTLCREQGVSPPRQQDPNAVLFQQRKTGWLLDMWWSSYKMSPSGFQTTTSQGLEPSPGVEEITSYYVWYVCECKCVYDSTYLQIRTVLGMVFSPPCRSSPLLLCCVLHHLLQKCSFPLTAVSPATFCHGCIVVTCLTVII